MKFKRKITLKEVLKYASDCSTFIQQKLNHVETSLTNKMKIKY